MKKTCMSARMVSLMLVLALLAGFALPVRAGRAEQGSQAKALSFEQTASSAAPQRLLPEATKPESQAPDYANTDLVRVSIVLDRASTIGAGYATSGIAANASAMSYRDSLKQEQAGMTASNERATGNRLDVVWNLTLAANLISANIPSYYVPAAEQRMDLYRRIASIRQEIDADDVLDELIDRYGDPPVGVANLIAIALLRARAAALGITELVQKEGSLRFSLPQPDFAKVAAVCGLEKYKGRLLFSAGDKPYLSLRLKKGDDVLKLAGIVLRDFEAAG